MIWTNSFGAYVVDNAKRSRAYRIKAKEYQYRNDIICFLEISLVQYNQILNSEIK